MGRSERSKQIALRKRIEEAERQAKVLRLFEEGLPAEEIAKRLELRRNQVEKDIQARIEKWRKASREKVNTYISREEERIARIWQEAFAAWHRSCEDAVTVTKEVVDGEKEKTTVRRTGQVGDAQFLRVMQQCIKDLRDMLGLDQPKRTEVTGRDGGPIGIARELSDDELLARYVELGGRLDGDGLPTGDGEASGGGSGGSGATEASAGGASPTEEGPW